MQRRAAVYAVCKAVPRTVESKEDKSNTKAVPEAEIVFAIAMVIGKVVKMVTEMMGRIVAGVVL